MKKSALGIFFRIPEYGRVKKRLAAEIGEKAALQAYESMLSSVMNRISKLKGIDIYGFYEGETSALEKLPFAIPFIRQQGNDLGEKMLNALAQLFERQYQKAALIGSDSPDLPLSFIAEAFERLDSHELVLGPSEDGGYYLIGMKSLVKDVFGNVGWGTGNALKDTISNAENAAINYFLLPKWYDIDDLESLKRWKDSALP